MDQDGLRQLDNAPLTRLHRRILFLVSLGEFVDGYDLLVIGGALLLLVPQFHLKPELVGLLGAASFLGATVGLWVFGNMTDRYGRRTIFMFNLVFFVVFAILSAFITNTTELFITRFLVGMAVGADIPTSTAFLAEISPSHRRGSLLAALPNLTWTIGAAISTFIALPLLSWAGPDAWRWMFGLAAIPAFLILWGRRSLPESPRWLLKNGRGDEAITVLKQLGVKNPDVSQYHEEPTRFWEIFGPEYRLRTVAMSLFFGLNCLAGPIVTISAPFVLRYVGLISVQGSLIFSGLIWVVGILGVLTHYALSDRLGRRLLATFTIVPEALCGVGIGLFGAGHPYVLVPLYFLLAYFSWSGPACLPWGWASELFPTRIRGVGQGFSNGICRLMIGANIFIIPVGMATIGFGNTILLLSVAFVLMITLVWLFPFFETRNVSLEQASGSVGRPHSGTISH